ncbi:zf-HC2 domain-containing protein [candidate division WOR-3 bacterium]|nr:zf-HC2 domain-containing protein [candidate division WOR-3 bacterium]MCK4527006.1 zf-HC2 domain-containing protein [candidate division WOR-3 bacterium]
MKDKHIGELIQGYIDGELSRKQEKKVREHLRECAECRRMLQEKKGTVKLIKNSIEEINVPVDLIGTIISQTSQKRVARVEWRYIAIGTAALFILTLVVFNFIKDSSHPISKDMEKQAPIEYTRDSEEPIPPKKQPEKVTRDKKIEVVKEDIDKKKEYVSFFEETRLVFPEEGSVVGDDFEIVIILREPTKKIDLKIDGENIKIHSSDSNILYIHSDSLPLLEKGIHYLSLGDPQIQSILFYKEG